MFKLFAPLAVAAIALTGTPAFAQTAMPLTVHVAVADLDLATPAGVRALDRRLAGAVHAVCLAPLTGDIRGAFDHHACLKVAASAAEQGRARVLADAGVARLRVAAR